MKKLVLVLLVGLISCGDKWDKEVKEYAKKRDTFFKYKEGDIVYLKPDSTLGVVIDRILWTEERMSYTIRYSTKTGKLEYLESYETNIFGKK